MIPIAARPSRDAALALLESAELPTSDLGARPLDDFFYAGSPAEPVGLVGLEIYGDSALLRSLVVAPSHRGAGLGAALVEHAEAHARSRGSHEIFLLTTTAETFFAGRGYVRLAREEAPAAIQATAEFSTLCPASSAFMRKRLKP